MEFLMTSKNYSYADEDKSQRVVDFEHDCKDGGNMREKRSLSLTYLRTESRLTVFMFKYGQGQVTWDDL